MIRRPAAIDCTQRSRCVRGLKIAVPQWRQFGVPGNSSTSRMNSTIAGAQVVRLHADTFVQPTPEPVPCTGLPTCMNCEGCIAEREALVARGVRRRTSQPYVPRPPRALRGAAA